MTQQRLRIHHGSMTEILRKKRRRKRKFQNKMMLSNQLSEAGDDTKRSKMRKNMKRIRKTKADHRIEKE
jgi:hypothetical protein